MDPKAMAAAVDKKVEEKLKMMADSANQQNEAEAFIMSTIQNLRQPQSEQTNTVLVLATSHFSPILP